MDTWKPERRHSNQTSVMDEQGECCCLFWRLCWGECR